MSLVQTLLNFLAWTGCKPSRAKPLPCVVPLPSDNNSVEGDVQCILFLALRSQILHFTLWGMYLRCIKTSLRNGINCLIISYKKATVEDFFHQQKDYASGISYLLSSWNPLPRFVDATKSCYLFAWWGMVWWREFAPKGASRFVLDTRCYCSLSHSYFEPLLANLPGRIPNTTSFSSIQWVSIKWNRPMSCCMLWAGVGDSEFHGSSWPHMIFFPRGLKLYNRDD